MQLVILVYHMSSASQMSKLIQVLASSYVFLNGFGHFQFFWKQNNLDQKQEKPLSTTYSTETMSEIQRFVMVWIFFNFFMVERQLRQEDK